MNDFRLDFLGIGAAKSGTSWLAACLSEHPEVCMSNPKELNYFCRQHIWTSGQSEYGKGVQWLRKRFSGHTPGQMRGEYSVSYLVDPESPALIKQHYPAAKLIVSFRNPVDALYSLYHQVAKLYPVADTFEVFCRNHTRLLSCGFYYSHIRTFMDHFPRESIHMILYDDICQDPRQVLTSLFGFLDIDSAFEPDLLFERVNVGAVPRFVAVRDLVGGAVEFFRTNPVASRFKGALNRLGVHHVANWIQKRNLRIAEIPPMREETRSWLVEIYEAHNRQLETLLGRDLSHWNE